MFAFANHYLMLVMLRYRDGLESGAYLESRQGLVQLNTLLEIINNLLCGLITIIALRVQRRHARPVLTPFMLPQMLIPIYSFPISIHILQQLVLPKLLHDLRDGRVLPVAGIPIALPVRGAAVPTTRTVTNTVIPAIAVVRPQSVNSPCIIRAEVAWWAC
jgi:hypothetical protein